MNGRFVLGQAEPTNQSIEVVYELARMTSLEGWWNWALLVAVLACLLTVCVRFYRRDVAELPTVVGWTLTGLRLATIVALIFFFFDLQRRAQRVLTRPSEVAVLVDTSQSMSLPTSTLADSDSRAQRAAALLGETELLTKLADEHRVSVYAFDQEADPRLLSTQGGDLQPALDKTPVTTETKPSSLAILGALLISIALLLGIAALVIGATGRADAVGWPVAASALMLFPGIISLSSAYSMRTEFSLAQTLGMESVSPSPLDTPPEPASEPAESIKVVEWSEQIAATGPQSRIGDAIQNVLTEHDPSTLAGIVLLSDGQSNGGVDSNAAVAAARRSEVALFPVGLGSSDAPVNVRVVDLDAPRRVYPGDKFSVSAVLQASGPVPATVQVQLIDGLEEAAQPGSDGSARSILNGGEVIDSQEARIANDGTLTGIRFELEPVSVGRRRLAVRVVAPTLDKNNEDDARESRYEVVSRKLRVLLIAGGPTREYRFVRNLLHRDKSVSLDVWLQTGRPGMSQDADQVLEEFPPTPDELFAYDAIAMFDPDWQSISAPSLDLLDRWLSQQAGGLVLVGGPVYHLQWPRLRDDRVSKIAGFFPVSVSTRGPLIGSGRQGGENAWPLKFTPEAQRAEFLWIDESPAESFNIWQEFGGVYDYVGVKNAKPGSKVYAYFSDPTTEVADSLPVYLASQFYGAGRVFFQGSGEIWRLRGESDTYFDSYYTKLIRWVSEGRLMRDSNRGILLVDTPRAMVGDTIAVRAVLTDEQFEPLDVPDISADLLGPNRTNKVRLQPLQGEPRAGTYGGRFIVRQAGSYELVLRLGDALEEQVLRQSIQVRLPTVELERPRRNDEELGEFAAMTGGKYLPVNNDTTDSSIAQTLLSLMKPQPQTTILPGTPDQAFKLRRNAGVMWLIATLLTMEWVVRRLHRLA